ncbi:MAG: hypothetical protein QW506_06730, partial [Thermoproteota archaeon]
WFTGEMKRDAFKFNQITEKILQENGSYEVKFEEKGSRIVRLHVLEPQKFDPKQHCSSFPAPIAKSGVTILQPLIMCQQDSPTEAYAFCISLNGLMKIS